jgi:hypothetical protein
MQSQKTFGRRTAPQQQIWFRSSASLAPVAEAGPAPAIVPPLSEEPSVDVDRELEEWKASRRIHKRSFREPWRSLAIAATVGFGLSSWLLPDSVADVAQLVTVGLCAASFLAGFRMRQPAKKLFSELHD